MRLSRAHRCRAGNPRSVVAAPPYPGIGKEMADIMVASLRHPESWEARELDHGRVTVLVNQTPQFLAMLCIRSLITLHGAQNGESVH